MGFDAFFKDKVVFVSGGSSGINLAIAEAFANEGARLSIISRSQEKVDVAVEKLKSYGHEAVGFSADVRDYNAVEEVIKETHKLFTNIDILISGAAGNFPAFASQLSANGFKSVVDIDLLGSFNVIRAAYPYLSKPGASIINISAPQAYVPMEMQIHVCAAKAGVDMLTRVLALEWGKEGIRINSLVPGPIAETEGMKRLAPTAELSGKVAASVPMGRMGSTRDIANAALVLCSPASEFINGAILPVDGGWSLSGSSQVMAYAANLYRNAQAGDQSK